MSLMFIQDNLNYSNLLKSILNSQLQNPYKIWEKDISLDFNKLFLMIENNFINIFHRIIHKSIFTKKTKIINDYICKLHKNLLKIKYFKYNKPLIKNHINLINNMLLGAINSNETIIISKSIIITYDIIHILKILINKRYEKFKNNLHIIIKTKLKVYIYIEKDVINLIHKFL